MAHHLWWVLASAFNEEDEFSNMLGSLFALIVDPNEDVQEQLIAFLIFIGAIDPDEFKDKEEYKNLPRDLEEAEDRWRTQKELDYEKYTATGGVQRTYSR